MRPSSVGAILVLLQLCCALGRHTSFLKSASTDDIDDTLPGRALLVHNGTDMALFCYEPQNRLTKTCTDWVLSHAQFQHKGTKAHELAVLTDIPADKCSAANGTSARSDVPRLAGTPSLEPWSDSVGKRIASYSQLIRCRFDVLSTFNCSDCVNKFGKTAELVSAYQDPARDDVFLLVFDKVLNALVLTFRATSKTSLRYVHIRSPLPDTPSCTAVL